MILIWIFISIIIIIIMFTSLIQAIKSVVRTNGRQAITGKNMQGVLLDMVKALGEYPTFAGMATPSTTPTTSDANVFYLAYEAGEYSGFGVTLDGKTYNIIRRTSAGWEVVNTNIKTSEVIAEVIAEAIAQAVEGVNDEIIDGELVAAAALNDLNDRVKALPSKENISKEIDAKLQAMRKSIVAMIDTLRAEIIDNELVAAASLNDLDRRMSDLPTTEQVEKDIETNTKEIYKLIDGVRNDIIEDELVAAAAITDLNNNI